MAALLRIKRSETGGNPAVLGAGELAYSGLADNGSNGGDRLYIGMGAETAGNAVNHVIIGGKYFTDMLDHSRGVLTANSALIVDTNKKLDELIVDNLNLNGNTISSADTDGNILLDPNGTGHVQAVGTNGFIIPVGTTAQRGPSVQGAIRFNTDISQFEGYGGANWASLGGVRSIDGFTYISAEGATGTADDGLLRFYAENSAGNAAVEVAQLNRIKFSILQTTGSTSVSTGALVVAGGVGIAENAYIGGNVAITGDLTVNGTTTTVNSTTVTITDPIFTLGGATAPSSDDNKDRGIEFRYHTGAAAKVGYFGFDDSTGHFTFIPDATNTSEVFTGATGVIDAARITGSAASWTTSRTVTFAGGDVTGSFGIDGSADVGSITLTAAIATSSVKGIASFNSTDFTVTSGAVSINIVDGGTY